MVSFLRINASYRSTAEADPFAGHVRCSILDRDCEREWVADKALVTDLSATEIDELAPQHSLASGISSFVEVQCIM